MVELVDCCTRWFRCDRSSSISASQVQLDKLELNLSRRTKWRLRCKLWKFKNCVNKLNKKTEKLTWNCQTSQVAVHVEVLVILEEVFQRERSGGVNVRSAAVFSDDGRRDEGWTNFWIGLVCVQLSQKNLMNLKIKRIKKKTKLTFIKIPTTAKPSLFPRAFEKFPYFKFQWTMCNSAANNSPSSVCSLGQCKWKLKKE